MRRIFVDLTDLEMWTGMHGGVQRVVYGIAKELYLAGSELKVVFVAFDNDRKLFYETSFDPIYDRVEKLQGVTLTEEPEVPRSFSALRRISIRQGLKRMTRIGKQTESTGSLPEAIKIEAGDTILVMGMSWESPNMQATLLDLKCNHGVKVAQVVYDLIICLYPHLHHPANYEPYTNNMLGVIESSDLLLPISQSSANDVKKFAHLYKLKVPEIEVIRLGDALANGESVKPKTEKKLGENFILCVGTVEIRKNHTLLYYTYKLAKERGIKLPQLVIVGGSGWFTGDIQYLLATDPEIKDDIMVLHNIEDAGLRWLYEHCQFTVYPSMYEGWGLPIAESLAYGKACVASGTSSMTEIGDGLVDYFSPYSSDELLDALNRMQNPKYRKDRETGIRKDYKTTSWLTTAETVRRRLGL